MENISRETYIKANARLRELIDIVTCDMDDNNPLVIEFLEIVSIVEDYEFINYPIDPLTNKLIKSSK